MFILHELKVSNFRSIREEVFYFCPLTLLVGKNDVGKSNVLHAIRILLEGSSSDIKQEDFFDKTLPIEIEAEFRGAEEFLPLCDEKNRSKVRDRISEGSLSIRRVAVEPGKLGKVEVYDPRKNEFGGPTGIDAPLKPMLPEVIYIPALADVTEEAKGTQKDALGQLLFQVLSSITTKVEPVLVEAFSKADAVLNYQEPTPGQTREDSRVPEIIEIESELTKHVQETFPSSSVRLKVRMPNVKDLISRVDLAIREGPHEDPYYRRGQGFQRTLYLGLLRALAKRVRDGDLTKLGVSRPFILLFEEPEAFLHPEGQTRMRHALEAIALRAQVLVSTHSPMLIGPDSVDKVMRIEKVAQNGDKRLATRRHGPISAEKLKGLERDVVPLFALQRSSRFLFSRGVLLVEGVGDEYLFQAIAKRLRAFDLDQKEICVVETSGKHKMKAFMDVLVLLGLRVWALVDLDFLWNGAGDFFQKDDDYARFNQELRRLVPPPPSGAPEAARRADKEQRIEVCRTQLVALRDALCDRLLPERVFVLRQGDIEAYVGLTPNSKSRYLEAASEIRDGKRAISHQRDFEVVLDALDAWAR